MTTLTAWRFFEPQHRQENGRAKKSSEFEKTILGIWKIKLYFTKDTRPAQNKDITEKQKDPSKSHTV